MKVVTSNPGSTPVQPVRIFDALARDRGQLLTSGLGAALLANVLWGTSFLASKATLQAWEPFTASALRFLVATVLMFLGLKIFRRKISFPKSNREWLWVLAIAISGFGALYPLQLTGLKLITSGMSAAIMLTAPLFVVVAGRLVLSERFTKRKLVGIFIGITGGTILLSGKNALALTGSTDFLIGMLLTVGAAISLALSVIATRKLSKSLDSASITFWSMGVGFILLAVSAQIIEGQNILVAITKGTPSAWSALLFLACVCSAFCFFIWNYALSKASPKEIASTMHIKTPTAVLLGVFAAGETLSAPLLIGTVIVMAGVWISQTAPKVKPA